MSETAVDIVTRVEAAGVPRAGQVLDLARWAGDAFATYDLSSVRRVCASVASAGAVAVGPSDAGPDGEKSTVPDLVSLRVYGASGADASAVLMPRPVGTVVLVARLPGSLRWLCDAVLAALAARNPVVVILVAEVAPAGADASDPQERQRVLELVESLRSAAEAAGAPAGVLQVVEHSSPAVVDAVTNDPRAAVVLRTPSGLVPVLVTASADPVATARRLLPEWESAVDQRVVVIVENTAAQALVAALVGQGAPPPVMVDSAVLLEAVDPGVGQEASGAVPRIGQRQGLLMLRVPGERRALRAAGAVLRLGGGNTVVVHSGDPAAVLAVAAALPVSQVIVNEALAAAAIDPGPLVTWTRVLVAAGDAADSLSRDLTAETLLSAYEREEASPWCGVDGPVPPYPLASNAESRGR